MILLVHPAPVPLRNPPLSPVFRARGDGYSGNNLGDFRSQLPVSG